MRFLPGPVDAAPGFTLDAGTRHAGQGTQNRRIPFDRNYVELLWIVDMDELHAQGLGSFAARCLGHGYPLGTCLRGTVDDRAPWTHYPQPDAPGFSLLLLTETLRDPRVPFVALIETADADLARRHPRARFGPQQADGIVRATFAAPRALDLAVRDATFTVGAPSLELDLGDRVVRYGNTSA